MSKITKLDDIEIYKESLILAKDIYTLCKHPKLKREYSLIDQIKRAAISVAANIAEGFGRNTKRDFAQFVSISLGSLNEVIAYLDFIALEFQLETKELRAKYFVLARRIHAFRSYLLKNN